MYVPHGLSLTIYEHDSWHGKEYTKDGDPFTDTRRGMDCINFPEHDHLRELEDRVSSAKVWRTGGAMAHGYWYAAASGINVKTQISVAFKSDHSETDSKSTTETLGVELMRGTEFNHA